MSKELLNARIQAALKLQHLCFDAASGERTAFINRDRAMDVVDAIAEVVVLTFHQHIVEEKQDAAHTN